LDDVSKPNEEMPETADEEVKDETLEESKSEPEEETEETSEEIEDEKAEEPEAQKAEEKSQEEPKKEEKTKKIEARKEAKKEEPKKKDDHRPDFKYIVRIANTDINGEKTLIHGLTSIKGIGMHMSVLVADTTGLDRRIKIGDLTDAQIDKIKETLDNLKDKAPGWMLNHRKDYETGKNIHLIGTDIDMRLRDEINIMKKIRSYRGVRHERGLRVRGQRTRTHGRKGLALGVSRKTAQAAAKAAKSDENKKE